MKVIPFKAEHLGLIKPQEKQSGILNQVTPAHGLFIETCEVAFTAVDGDEIIACAGIIPLWPGRGHAWAVMSNNIGNRFIRVHRAVKRAIELSSFRRIEMCVDSEFLEAVEWAHMLGFVDETPNGMPGYTDDGRLYHQFARVI